MRTTITMGSLALCLVTATAISSPASARQRHHARHPAAHAQTFPLFKPFMTAFAPDTTTTRSKRRARKQAAQPVTGLPFLSAFQPQGVTPKTAAATSRSQRRAVRQQSQFANNAMPGSPNFMPVYEPFASESELVKPARRARRTASLPVYQSMESEPVATKPSRRPRRAASLPDANGGLPPGGSAPFGDTMLVAEARRWIGGNPTGRASLWCGHFMNFVLERTGHRASPSNTARSFASYGRRVSGPQVGAIAVMSRGAEGGHVGVVSGIDAKGNPIIISGNYGHRVAEATFPRGRIYAYVMP